MTTEQELALGYTTALAALLNGAMESDAARAAYRAQWGEEWSPLGNGAVMHDGATTTAATVR